MTKEQAEYVLRLFLENGYLKENFTVNHTDYNYAVAMIMGKLRPPY